ncbi:MULTISPECIES: NAD(P)/FAD-dependent oxidoreductase [unclassified Streptomyces]|uniref:NAD(P)/FAD-dependent oxidoreductase n=1 Tax=unclassified Streptomyces TaxID=2593676 RepID=UPI0022B5FE43|nr:MULTISPECIES: tryptophan 7-halogenase [unclassified Streptomyces]MCZ7413498.1 tryptophan 7-halogenase [Streptomyces sp. WMMC897]MCZ7430492.1 tryptophan 7-halogenase [Streptomyces sp. WMMC1477]
MPRATTPRQKSGKKSERPDTDVIILGSGLAGAAMAAVLARGGANVLVLDAGSHPRFAIGESTIPYTSMLMRLVSERYDVPEIKYLTTFENVQGKISSTSGIKKNFGFLYHREGERQNTRETHQFPIPRITHIENHFFRQDVDSWMLNVAVKYGAKVQQRTRIVDVDFDDEGGTLTDDKGTTYRTRYVVDASGFRSPLATKFGLREEPTRLRHHSRSLFTHMLGVTPYDDLLPRSSKDAPTPWHQGTLHHLFEGGWAWVIPFDNHARATNPLVSVGLNLDPRVHPEFDGTAEEEFRAFIDRFPDIRRQFGDATAVRPWVRTGRLQYSSKTTIGARWCLTSHAAGFVDALFSRGLSNSFEIINALAWRVLEALKDDDFTVERFKYVEQLEQGLLDFNDNLVANAYTSFSHYGLWDTWFRVWSLGQILATFEINRTYARYLDSHDAADLAHLESIAPEGSISDYGPARELLAFVSDQVQDVAERRTNPGAAAASVMNALMKADFVPPAFGLADPTNRWFNASPLKVMDTIKWARNEAPPEIGRLVDDGLTLFIKKRLSPDEFDLREELKHVVAGLPLVGRPLRSSIAR